VPGRSVRPFDGNRPSLPSGVSVAAAANTIQYLISSSIKITESVAAELTSVSLADKQHNMGET
jgi:hypothetical protein